MSFDWNSKPIFEEVPAEPQFVGAEVHVQRPHIDKEPLVFRFDGVTTYSDAWGLATKRMQELLYIRGNLSKHDIKKIRLFNRSLISK